MDLDTAVPTRPGSESVTRLPASPGVVSPAPTIAGLPGPRSRLPFGSLLEARTLGLHAALESWADHYGPFYRIRLGKFDFVGLADPVLIAEILRSRPARFARGGRLSQLIEETGTRGLFTAEGEHWRRQRKLVMRAFTPESIKAFFPLIHTVTGRLERRWRAAARAGTPVDAAGDIKRFAVDIATWLSFGEDINTVEHPDNPLQADIEFWFALMGKRMVSPIPYWKWFSLGPERRMREASERIRVLIERVLRETRARLAADPRRASHPANIVEALVAARDAPDSEFTDTDVAGNMMTMLFAGEDTVANAIAWMLLDIADRPEVRARVRAEVDREIRDGGSIERFEQLAALTDLEALAHESMRIKPIAPIMAVKSLEEIDLAGLRIPRGQHCFLALRVASRRSGAFADFDRIDLDRWARADGEASPSPDAAAGVIDARRAVFPFGGGQRLCPGRYLAMVEMKMVAAMALRHFEIAVEGDAASRREHFTFTLAPRSLRLRLRERVHAPAAPATSASLPAA
jgi:cytochrome P450